MSEQPSESQSESVSTTTSASATKSESIESLAAKLPQTGTEADKVGLLGGLSALAALVAFKRKKKEDEIVED